MTAIQAALLGLVEGLTEFLPVSSTAHLIITARLLGLAQTEFVKSFEIIIQLGAIAAVLAVYWRSLLDFEILKRLAAAFVPTGIVGLLAYKLIKQYLLADIGLIIATLALGGLLIVLFERWHQEKADAITDIRRMSYRQCLAIGVFQSLAVVPGVSRSAATIIGGLLLGLSRKTIVEFSFLLAVPTMLAATGLDLIKNASAFSASDTAVLAVGFVVSLLTALVAIKWLLAFVRRRRFTIFGAYRIILAALLLLLLR